MTNKVCSSEIKQLSNEEIAVVFSSCDKYKPIWESFFDLFSKYMPKAKYHFYGTVADDYSYKEYFVKGNNYKGRDQSFSTRLLVTLKNIPNRYVLFFLDDFYLIGKVDETIFVNALNVLKSDSSIKNIILKDFVKASCRCDSDYNDMFSIVKKKAPFRCTTQISFFDKNYLISLLRKGESAWEFEFYGSYRARVMNKKVLFRKDEYHNCIPYYDAGYLRKGKFNPVYESFASENNLERFDFSSKKFDNIDDKEAINNKFRPNILSVIKKSIHKLYDNSYPVISCLFRFKKRISGSIPKYIKKMNSFSKDEAMK